MRANQIESKADALHIFFRRLLVLFALFHFLNMCRQLWHFNWNWNGKRAQKQQRDNNTININGQTKIPVLKYAAYLHHGFWYVFGVVIIGLRLSSTRHTHILFYCWDRHWYIYFATSIFMDECIFASAMWMLLHL